MSIDEIVVNLVEIMMETERPDDLDDAIAIFKECSDPDTVKAFYAAAAWVQSLISGDTAPQRARGLGVN